MMKDLRIVTPLRSIGAKGSAGIKSLMRFVERLSALFLLEQVGDDVAARGQANLVALDLGNQALGDEMVMLLMADTAVGPDELDAIVFDPVDGADMRAVRADHFHMLAN